MDELSLLRMAAQRLVGPRAATPLDAVRWLTAVQGQDLPGALTSVALRTAGGTRAAVTAALDAGEVVGSWPMRGTLHLVAADDLPWMLELLGLPAEGGPAGVPVEQATSIAAPARPPTALAEMSRPYPMSPSRSWAEA